jgi:hypothetical protein
MPILVPTGAFVGTFWVCCVQCVYVQIKKLEYRCSFDKDDSSKCAYYTLQKGVYTPVSFSGWI